MNILSRIKKSGLARDTTHLSIGQGLRLIIQAAYFVLIARLLGPNSYGAFVAIVAMAAALGPFSGLGTPNLFIKNVRSNKRESAACWGNGLLLTVLSGSVLSLVVLALNLIFQLRNPLFIVFVISLSDLVLMKVTELASFGFAAVGRMKDTSILSVVISLFRLLGIFVLSLTEHSVSLRQWAIVYLLTSVAGVVYTLVRSTRLWGMPRLQLSALREDIAEGVFFSISTSATSIYNDVDKMMLGKLSDFVSTGIYSAAYRVIDVSMTPVRSLVSAAYPEFFRKGIDGIGATYSYALGLISKAVVYGGAISLSLWLAAPILPHILGPQYKASVPALRWLALIPLLRCVHVFLADSLSGAGFQRTRTAIQVFVGVVNVGLNLLILPIYSWLGAAWTSLACDAMLVGIFWATALYLVRRQQTTKLRPLEVVEFGN